MGVFQVESLIFRVLNCFPPATLIKGRRQSKQQSFAGQLDPYFISLIVKLPRRKT